MSDTTFIYALCEPDTGEVRYVGKADKPEERYRNHLKDRRGRCHRIYWIQSILHKGQKPVLEILDEVPAEFWPQWEVAYIQFFLEQGFNLVNSNAGGEGSLAPTPEVCAKIRNWHLGRKHSQETLSKLRKPKSEAHCVALRKPKTAQACLNMSLARIGKKQSEDQKNKKSLSMLGNTFNLGREFSETWKKNLSESKRGKRHSLETREKMRIAQAKRRAEETGNPS